MADAFGDDLFRVFEQPAAASAARKSKAFVIDGVRTSGKRSEEKSSAVTTARPKRKAEVNHTENALLGKKRKLEDGLEDDNLADVMPWVRVQAVETVEGCTHEVALPANEEFTGLKPRTGKAAKEYPFILDAFQREAILCVDNKQSVLVSAHTSAGKTVCAEYAIALALREKQRVIFTSPIKALSNQKYREMYEEFQDVGLMTGDVTINPTASCLVMTTEILRSMLYRGSEVMREVAWVIFDEIHYMRDSERGVVWEETIILLPDNVHYVFLSATIPNARQFAEWICHLHKQPCHVIYTDYRPTPLQHYIFPAGGDGLHLVVDENGDFREDNFNTAMQVLRDAGDLAKGDQKGRKGGTKGPSNVFKIVKMITERNFQPVIIFSFSKKDCEAYALQMTKLDFNTDEEKKMVEEVFNNAIDCLSDEDKKLPQVEHVLPLLKRGIGIHHGGLLPILKETIEILFSEGLIKALFATETFAMGINMPARTVLFTSASKFDGKDFRWISSGEYIQMSGRAGRRGMDDRGIVILMVDEKMSPTVGKQLLKGSADPLNSAFHLTYNMVLNLLRVEEINPEYMLEKSFYQFQHYRTIPEIVERVTKLERQYNKILIPNEENVVIYYKIRQQLAKMSKEIEQYVHKPKYCLPFLQPGRLVKVKCEDDNVGWGVVVNFSKKSNAKPNSAELDSLYVVEVLLYCSKDSLKNSTIESAKPISLDEKGEMQVVPILVHLVAAISSVRLYIPKDLRPVDNRQSVLKSIKIAVDIKAARRELKKARTVLQMDELKCRKRVLRRLGFATSSDVIEMKGRVACEISSADELLLTEMMFNGIFNDLSPEQTAALLSCFVFQENSSEMPKLTEQLAGPLRQMQECAKRIAKVSAEAKLEIDEENYLNSFRPHLMDVVHTWANGANFAHICKMTDVFEGSIIRCMRRLEELLRQMCQAAKAIGNTELENKFAEGITKIKRDIVFAASLYL
ncbi:exosome RNA helicase MTR4 isoform X4 [Pezoporus wallicus]|uniref:exosome RNA helicase MTR4 isoform X4 n=1 Tax=Pezoporus wallicus TaxID=35540 RepID=UPI00254C2B67|nr:exosome RNA helicase MTR4 isoform X4 [Pezoporus wallicus]XP_061325391.1 exosome RNA helicase MTR4 isoform X5 [Pezoporus flaviventris]